MRKRMVDIHSATAEITRGEKKKKKKKKEEETTGRKCNVCFCYLPPSLKWTSSERW